MSGRHARPERPGPPYAPPQDEPAFWPPEHPMPRPSPPAAHPYAANVQAPERDPFDETRPDHRRRQDEPGTDAEGEEQPRREPRLRPRDRRVLEAIALLTLLPALLLLRWTITADDARKVTMERPEKATVVPRNAIGEWSGARWRLYGQSVGTPLSTGGAAAQPDVAELRLSVAVRPETPAAARMLLSLDYRLADAEGHLWTARGTTSTTPRPGMAMRLLVTGTVPRSKTGAVVLELRPPPYSQPKGPLPLLRFER
ncbi:hypothetical protein ACQP1W_03475 [Spirillospora sp. CA-255316]